MDEQRSRRTLGIPDSRSGSYLNLEAELISLRRALTTTSGNLLVRVPLSSENYIPNVQGWNFNLNGNAELNNVVVRGAIEANGVFTGTLGANTVNAININANQVTAGFLNVDRLQVNSINGNRITNNTLDGGKIANGSITAGKIGALEITANQIANLTIDASKIGNLQINNDKLADGAVSTVKIANLAVTNAKIASISASKITAGTISANFTMSGSVSVTGSLSSTNANFFPNSGIWASGLSQLQLGSASIGFGVNVNAAVFPRIDSLSTHLRLRATGEIRSKGSGGFVIEDGLTNTSAAANTFVNVVGRIFRGTSSSRSIKKDIEYKTLPGVLELRPVGFMPVDEDEGYDVPRPQYGLILEDVVETGPVELITYDAQGKPQGISYDRIGAALIPYVRDLEERVSALENANG